MGSSKVSTKGSKKKSGHSKKDAKTNPATSNLSTEFIQDSDKEDEEPQEESEAESEDEASSDEESLPENPAAISKKMITIPPAGSSSSSENEDESANESGSGEEEQPSAKKVATASRISKQAAKEPAAKTVTFQKPAPFKPPPGFENDTINDSTQASKLFKKSHLERKQIWYITAPASVSISSIKQLSLQDITKGKTLLSHNGSDYGFAQDTSGDKTYTKIMAPSASDDGYRIVSKSIDQVLHLQRVTPLPGVGTDSNPTATSQATVPAEKPVRPQPKGLKMRFLPIGFGNGRAGRIGSDTSDDTSSSESASNKVMVDGPTSPAKRTAPASKKSKTSSDSSEDESSASDVEMADAPILPTKPAIKPKSARETQVAVGGVKRKHGEGTHTKSKNSSSKSTITTDERKLKMMKTKQDESRKSPTGSQSASTEASKPPPKASSPIRPSPNSQVLQPRSPAIRPPTSDDHFTVKTTPISPPQLLARSSAAQSVSTPRKVINQTPTKDSKANSILEDQINAVDPSLTAEERRQEIRRLKRNESSRLSKAKHRESILKPVDQARNFEAVKSSPAILPPRPLTPISQAIDDSIARSSGPSATKSKEEKDKKKRRKEAE